MDSNKSMAISISFPISTINQIDERAILETGGNRSAYIKKIVMKELKLSAKHGSGGKSQGRD